MMDFLITFVKHLYTRACMLIVMPFLPILVFTMVKPNESITLPFKWWWRSLRTGEWWL